MARQYPAGILDADATFHGRFGQVTPETCDCQQDGQDQTIETGKFREKPPTSYVRDDYGTQSSRPPSPPQFFLD